MQTDIDTVNTSSLFGKLYVYLTMSVQTQKKETEEKETRAHIALEEE